MKKYVVTIEYYPIPRIRKLDTLNGLNAFINRHSNSFIMTEDELKDIGLTITKIKELGQIVRNSKKLNRIVENFVNFERENGYMETIKKSLHFIYPNSTGIKKIIKFSENDFRLVYSDEYYDKIYQLFEDQKNKKDNSLFYEYIISSIKRKQKIYYDLINAADNYSRGLSKDEPKILITPDVLPIDIINNKDLDFLNTKLITNIINFIDLKNIPFNFNMYKKVGINFLNNLVVYYLLEKNYTKRNFLNTRQLEKYGHTLQSYLVEKYNSKMRVVLKSIIYSPYFKKSFKDYILNHIEYMSNIEDDTLKLVNKLKMEV